MAYEKQVWKNLPNQTTPLSAARLNHLETQYDEAVATSRGLIRTFSVLDFGAVGGGEVDDSPAFQRAINAIKSAGGGTLWVPPGVYWTKSIIQLCNNLVIEGTGAVLLRGFQPGYGGYTYFRSPEGMPPGWGGALRDVTVRGLTFRGNFSPSAFNGGVGSGFSLNHAENILLEGMLFDQVQGPGHGVADLIGCQGVTLRDLEIRGMNILGHPTSAAAAEAIQIGLSVEGAANPDPPTSHDALPCRDILVENFKSTSITNEYGSFYAPNPFGNHDTNFPNGRHQNVTLRGITVENPYPNVDSPNQLWRGVIHGAGIDDLLIDGLHVRFVDPYSTTVVGLATTSSAEVGNTVIQNVTVDGTLSGGGHHPIAVRGSTSSPKKATVRISNVFINAVGVGDGGTPTSAVRVDANSLDTLVMSNVFVRGDIRLISSQGVREVSVTGCESRGSTSFQFVTDFSGIRNVRISNSSIAQSGVPQQSSVYAFNCENVSVECNTFEQPLATNRLVRFNKVKNFSFLGNSGLGPSDEWVLAIYGGEASSGVVSGNNFRGLSKLLQVSDPGLTNIASSANVPAS